MKGYIYLIHSSESGKYKIGVSQNPIRRLKQLQTGSGERLKLIEKYESEHYQKIEKVLHNKYAHLNAEGEWFNLYLENETTFIDECKKIEENIEILRNNNNPFI